VAIDASQIGHLRMIAKCGSFTRAAAAIGVSQPALSNSIALLEQRIGARVLDRSRHGSTLTPVGEILMRRAEAVVTLLADAELEVKRHRQGVAGPLRIGATPSVLTYLVPEALRRLVVGREALDIEVVDELDEKLTPILQAGDIDIVVGPVGGLFPVPANLQEEFLVTDPMSVAVGPTHPFFKSDTLALSELRDASWILPRPGSAFRRYAEALFLTASIPWPTDCILTNSLRLIEILLSTTNRVACVSKIQFVSRDHNFKLIQLSERNDRKIGFKISRTTAPSPLLKEFCECLRAVTAEMATSEIGG
jgi:DNA-binding transcriptional LysR family regulator